MSPGEWSRLDTTAFVPASLVRKPKFEDLPSHFGYGLSLTGKSLVLGDEPIRVQASHDRDDQYSKANRYPYLLVSPIAILETLA